MRMRKHKHTEERLAACQDLLPQAPEELQGKWREEFARRMGTAPAGLELEIGCGKGGFMLALAQSRPDTAYVAVELCREAMLLAVEKCRAADLKNVLFLCVDARGLDQVFQEGEIDRIYLNFSDPWPKSRHAKRRLTAPAFLALYQKLLSPQGEIRQKTDNVGLFEFSLQSFQEAGWALLDVTDDLHHSPQAEGNIMTEYEKNFSEKGFPIHALTARPQ